MSEREKEKERERVCVVCSFSATRNAGLMLPKIPGIVCENERENKEKTERVCVCVCVVCSVTAFRNPGLMLPGNAYFRVLCM